MSKNKSISLYYRQGSSDKEYHAKLEETDGGFVVNVAFGRRGAALTTGTKTSTPVTYEKADKIYEKLVKEKLGKGYTEGNAGSSYVDTAKVKTDIQCVLLNPIDEEDVERLILDDSFAAQEKYDGRRLLIEKRSDGSIVGINRKGIQCGIPEKLARELQDITRAFILDGELIENDVFMVFDILKFFGNDLTLLPFKNRLEGLNSLFEGRPFSYVKLSKTAFHASEKRELFESLQDQEREGIVFKNVVSPYTSGRPASGGNYLKFKFYETGSFVVEQVNDKRSVSLSLFKEGTSNLVSAGNVTIPPNHLVPAVGSIVEVRYLYAYPESGSIYQPVYLGARTDIDITECHTGQLKYKNTLAEV